MYQAFSGFYWWSMVYESTPVLTPLVYLIRQLTFCAAATVVIFQLYQYERLQLKPLDMVSKHPWTSMMIMIPLVMES